MGRAVDERLWAVREIAEKLTISRKTVYEWINAGDLKCIRLGKQTRRVREQELERFLREKEEESYPFPF